MSLNKLNDISYYYPKTKVTLILVLLLVIKEMKHETKTISTVLSR